MKLSYNELSYNETVLQLNCPTMKLSSEETVLQ